MIVTYKSIDFDCQVELIPAERAIYSEGACVEPDLPADAYIEAVSINGSADLFWMLSDDTLCKLYDLVLESLGDQA
jgi:hypothetical protein